MTKTSANSLRTYLVQSKHGYEIRWTNVSTDRNREDAGKLCADMWMFDPMFRQYRVISYPLCGERNSRTMRIEDL